MNSNNIDHWTPAWLQNSQDHIAGLKLNRVNNRSIVNSADAFIHDLGYIPAESVKIVDDAIAQHGATETFLSAWNDYKGKLSKKTPKSVQPHNWFEGDSQLGKLEV